MSWHTGSEILLEIWPIVKEKITDDRKRKEFGRQLVNVFIANDIDTYDLYEVDPELDEIVSSLYE